MATVVTSTGKGPGGQRVEVGGARAETAHGLVIAPRRHGDPVLGFADVDTSGVVLQTWRASARTDDAGSVGVGADGQG